MNKLLMIKEYPKIFCFLILTVIAYNSSAVASTERGAFTITRIGARSSAFGEAFAAIADNANAIRWNPAGLSSLKQLEVTFSRTSLFSLGGFFDYIAAGGISQDFVGIAYPRNVLTFGLSFLFLRTHNIIEADEIGTITNRNRGYAERTLK